MKYFTQHLIDLGYEPWRYSCIYPSQNSDAKNQNINILKNKEKYQVEFVEGDDKEGSFYFKSIQPAYDFSTMRVGGIHTHWVKDKDFKSAIVWGLNEGGRPPTLIKPRPKIKVEKEGRILTEQFDDAMNICLAKEDHILIYNSLFNEEKTFLYKL